MLSKIKNIQSSGTFESKHGMLYKFEYEFEDGVSLMANHKTQQSPFKVGDEVEYEIRGTNDYGSYGAVKAPQNDSNGSNFNSNASARDSSTQDQIMRQTCLKCAAEFYAQSSTGENDVVMTAARWFEWVKTGNMKLKQ